MTEQTVTAEALNDLRQRYLRGEEWSRQELKNAIHTMIGDRIASVQDAQPKAKKAKAVPVSLDDMLPGATPVKVEQPTLEVTNVENKVIQTKVKPTDGGGFF